MGRRHYYCLQGSDLSCPIDSLVANVAHGLSLLITTQSHLLGAALPPPDATADRVQCYPHHAVRQGDAEALAPCSDATQQRAGLAAHWHPHRAPG